jgi:predicted cupin superfamily sugar epimerase
MTIDFIVNQLNLQPHPEGGFYKEVYRSSDVIKRESLPLLFSGSRAFSTSIYFLIKADSFSAFHRIKSDETWHFYFGHALEIIEIDEFGTLIKTMVGSNLIAGEVFQYTVKKTPGLHQGF